jgi:hypothetical protein
MRILFVLIAATASFAAEIPITVVGEFTNMRFTGEHQYGYAVQLWRQGDRVFGLFSAAAGLQGDTPTGMLDDIRFDPRTGALSFRAKLTTGLVHENGSDRPARDLFVFGGKLDGNELSGTVKPSESGRPQAPEKIRLKRQNSDHMFEPARYEEWQRKTAEIIRVRGPRW